MENVFFEHEIIKTNSEGIFILDDAVKASEDLLKSYSGKITLIYIDPPFCSGNDFRCGGVEAYSDKMPESEYMDMMSKILKNAHELLSDEGSLYLHIDYRMSGKLRMLSDKIFGENNLRNEIIWSYNSGGRTKRCFPHKHDTIFFYSKTSDYYFNIEATGTPRGTARRNNMKKNTDENGLIYYSIRSGGKEYRYYENDLVYPTDVWTDIEHLHQRDKERTSYPTQKPIALLNRIINASSYTGAYVCDFFSGSGTSAKAADDLNRKWIAVDKSPLALMSLKNRLTSGGRNSHIHYNGRNTQIPNIDIQKSNDKCILSSDADIMFLSKGHLSNGVYIEEERGLNIDVRDDNAAICVGSNDGKIGIFKLQR